MKTIFAFLLCCFNLFFLYYIVLLLLLLFALKFIEINKKIIEISKRDQYPIKLPSFWCPVTFWYI